MIACCIASCGDLKEAVDHDPLFPHHEQIFEAVLKCLVEENEEIQSSAFSALKEVVFRYIYYLSTYLFFIGTIFSHAERILHILYLLLYLFHE